MSGGRGLSRTPQPPYWAVVFASVRSVEDSDGYARAAEEMMALAAEQPGFLGVETARGTDGVGITVSYWTTPEAILAWRENARHRIIQQLGKEKWYVAFEMRIARVERAYSFER
jgi:heme-degrading monooxygenase HmoA